MSEHIEIESETFIIKIWIGGDYDYAKIILGRMMKGGGCVSVKKCDYVYTFGQEPGICVTFINYPLYPKTHDEVFKIAKEIGFILMNELNQGSFTIQGKNKTKTYSRRSTDLEKYEEEIIQEFRF